VWGGTDECRVTTRDQIAQTTCSAANPLSSPQASIGSGEQQQQQQHTGHNARVRDVRVCSRSRDGGAGRLAAGYALLRALVQPSRAAVQVCIYVLTSVRGMDGGWG